MKKQIQNSLLVLVALTTVATSRPVHALTWEDVTIASLSNRELSFFGIDADVRRMLNDPDFENDVRKWWQVVNPAYVDDMTHRGEYDDETIPEAQENKSWAQRSNLDANNGSQYRMRILFSQNMDSAIPSEKTQMYLAYFLRTGQKEKARSLLRIYAQDYALWAREALDDPRFASASPQ
ncbi:MAG TPA: hypothetical protein VL588_05600, partial [Bdellovibrionota bacterium]|nr:hypothetical protein [Bdellovibrionota bacterium]